MKRAFLFFFFVVAGCVLGAQVYREEFVGGASGWTNDPGATGGSVTPISNLLRINFPPAGMPMLGSLAISTTNNTSGGAFTGDYAAAQISLMGFRIRSLTHPNVFPRLEWDSGSTTTFRRAFSSGIAQTGVWYEFSTSLKDISDAEWAQTGATGLLNRAYFAACLQTVTAVRVVIPRPHATAASSFELDAVYLDRIPEATSLSASTSSVEVIWAPLQTGLVYAVETAMLLDGPWTSAAALTATGRTQSSVTAWGTNASPVFFRLKN